MLEIKKISKVYITENLKQTALDDVSINFRKNEFASILGPSGSGKTTLLNIIGGLDHYDKGDLIINEISTKKYNDRDWDSYRNHRVGFVFQSYNLISHQTILQNVELALTLSGVSKNERRKRAKKALKEVGLEKHIHKKPSQLSGGQMQRVAIARALVNDPDILLADEPTGALDSVTSEQIMGLLKKVAEDKLVIMVTHNPELAEKYSTRIVKLKDGVIIDDSNPYDGKEDTRNDYEKELKKTKKTSMNLKTALSLSLNNLMTKKGRTMLTAFAGSIGIIGIALILSLSNGVQEYIDKTEKETLSSYPLSIESTSIDFSSMMTSRMKEDKEVTCKDKNICTTDDITNNFGILMSTATVKNNLKEFKKSLDANYKNINDYVTDIQYMYNLDLQIYSSKTDNGMIKVNPNTLDLSGNGTSEVTNSSGMMAMSTQSSNVFEELIDNDDLLSGQYDILTGRMPKSFNELVLVVDENSQIPASVMYSLDIEDRSELTDVINKVKKKEEVSLDSINYDYTNLVGTKYKLVLNTDYYKKENGIWKDYSKDTEYLKELVNNAIELEIVGVIKVSEDAVEASSSFVGYTHDLVEYVINKINDTDIAKEQLDNKDTNILTGFGFDGFTSTYESNLALLGINDLNNPNIINIYPKDYDSKERIIDIIDAYNNNQSDENKIQYTDYVGVLMSGITTIVNVITYVLIAFVAISLIVSSIMIAIITYISVLERTKEIGILRAIGASKKDVTRVFNAETMIEGLVAGVMGILITLLLNIPINAIVKSALGVTNIASLPVLGAITLIIISVLLTVIAGLIPSRMASKKDPVESLRSE